MTPKQESLYWREWAAVRRVDPEADRHALHARAEVRRHGLVTIGAPQSHKVFDNDDFSGVLALFRSISQPTQIAPQLRHVDEHRRRLIWKIEQLAPEAYRAVILRDRFAGKVLADLSDEDLKQMLYTLSARANAQRKIARQPEPALAAADGSGNNPF